MFHHLGGKKTKKDTEDAFEELEKVFRERPSSFPFFEKIKEFNKIGTSDNSICCCFLRGLKNYFLKFFSPPPVCS